jgi:hypothetical protein
MAYEEQITGKYYIVGVDTRDDLHLSYSIGAGSYVGKAPGEILRYGFNDTFLVAETDDGVGRHAVYYVIDMTKDSEYAHEKDFRIGPISKAEYEDRWSSRLKIKFQKVQSQ